MYSTAPSPIKTGLLPTIWAKPFWISSPFILCSHDTSFPVMAAICAIEYSFICKHLFRFYDGLFCLLFSKLQSWQSVLFRTDCPPCQSLKNTFRQPLDTSCFTEPMFVHFFSFRARIAPGFLILSSCKSVVRIYNSFATMD